MAIDETKHAFGLDFARYASSNGLMDFEVAAKYRPYVRFVGIREGISWAYKDPFFDYHWGEAATMHKYRDDDDIPVGRFAYHVIYPGEDIKRQVLDNLFKNIGNNADWVHDRIAIDAELDHQQSPARITYALNTFGELCKSETGMLPVIYSRYYWLKEHTIPSALLPFEWWMAQYLNSVGSPAFTPERVPPPLPNLGSWLATQTTKEANADLWGVYGKHYFDNDRWNGGVEKVMEYFKLKEPSQPPLTIDEQVAKNTADIHDLQGRVKSLEEGG